MQANANQQAVIDKYGFELKDDPKDWIIVDPVVRKANRGKGGRYVSGNLDECLARAVVDRKEAEKSMRAPSDKTERKNARAKTNPSGKESADDVTFKAEIERHDLKVIEDVPPEVPPSEQEPIQIESHVEPVRLGELNETLEYTSAQEAILFKYGLSVTRDAGSFRIIDLEVQQYYAFRDASKKGRYEGTDLDELLETAAKIHDGMVAEKGAKNNNKTRQTKSKKPKVKEEKKRRANAFELAFPLIAANKHVTADDIAKAGMSKSMAAYTMTAWNVAVRVFGDNNLLTVDASTLRVVK